MTQLPYNIGRLLHLLDALHKEYCFHVRKEKLPSQLMGNEVLLSISERPAQGILYLRDRAKVYLAWAETAQGDDLGWTKTILREIGKTAKVLEGTELPDQFDTKAQAELFLGYLSTIYTKKSEEQEATSHE